MNASLIFQQTVIETLTTSLKFLYIAIIIFLPFMLLAAFWKSWVMYVRYLFWSTQKHILVEIKIPREVVRSPLAMELFLGALSQTGGEANWYYRFWLGKTRAEFSLEIISDAGQIRFFIRTRESLKGYIESQLYAQFPEIELNVVDDYVQKMIYEPGKIEMFGVDFVKSGPSHIPIKTYTHYGLDKESDEEVKIDPITAVMEFFATMGRGEQIWLQIAVRAHKKEMKKPGTWFEKVDWKHAAEEDIKKKMKRDKKPEDGAISFSDLSMTKGEREVVEAIEKNLSKMPFDIGIRMIYTARVDSFKGVNIGGMLGSLKQYNAANLNGFRIANTPSFDYPWQDFSGKRTIKLKHMFYHLYRDRKFFYPEFFPRKYSYKPFVLSSEELATIYHFPGQVAMTPTINRVVAKKAEPPANLPI